MALVGGPEDMDPDVHLTAPDARDILLASAPSAPDGADEETESEKTSSSMLLCIVVGFSAITGLLMGFDLSIIAVVLNPVQKHFHICPGDAYTCFKRELFVSIIGPGALVGSLGGGLLADRWGRRYTLILSDVCFIFGSGIFYIAGKFWHMIVGRIIVGIGVGIGFVVFSTYVAEVAPSSKRGRLILFQEIAQCVGVLMTYLLASVLGSKYWQELLASAGILALIQLLGIYILPESPRWLLMQDRIIEARNIIKRLGLNERELMTGQEELRRIGSGVVRNDVFWSLWVNRKPMVTACFVGIAQNVLCMNAALYYSTDLFLLAGVCKPYQWGIGLGVMKFFGTIIAYSLVDTFGRRRLLMTGTGELFFVFILLSVAYSWVPQKDIQNAEAFCQSPDVAATLYWGGLSGSHAILMVVGMLLLVLGWEMSWAGLMYVVAAEIIPSDIRGIGMGVVICCFWISLFISQLLFELMFRLITISGTFVGLSVASLVIILLTFLFVPDMTGKSLETIVRLMTTQPGNDGLEDAGGDAIYGHAPMFLRGASLYRRGNTDNTSTSSSAHQLSSYMGNSPPANTARKGTQGGSSTVASPPAIHTPPTVDQEREQQRLLG